MSSFLRDETGYLGWLADNADGYVLNTWPHAAAGYLVLHRATCRTINRDQGPTRRWTEQYLKVCATTREELEAWSRDQVHAAPAPCGNCLPQLAAARGPVGSRRPAHSVVPGPMIGDPVLVRVPRLDGGPELRIQGAQWLAEQFFLLDASAIGPLSYDAATRTTPPQRFVPEDITTLNRTMAARTGHVHWADLLVGDPSPILSGVPTDANLVTSIDSVKMAVAAIDAMRGPYRGLAVVTKMLHLKRPALVPVLDSLVLDQLGSRGRSLGDIVAHVREVATSNRDALSAIAAHLAAINGVDGRLIERTHVRILDALLWSTHPASVLYPLLDGWRTTVVPVRSDTPMAEPPREDGPR